MAIAGKWKVYEPAKEFLMDGTIDLDTHTFEARLFLSTSNCNTLSNTILTDLTNEHASANGYAPITLAGVTWAQAAGTAKFDSNDPVWTAAGGSIIARFGVLVRTGTVNTVTNALLAVCLLDTAPADKTATAGNTLTLTINASGIFTLSGAAVD